MRYFGLAILICLLFGCSRSGTSDIEIESVDPRIIVEGDPATVEIVGRNFYSRIIRRLNGSPEFDEVNAIEVWAQRTDLPDASPQALTEVDPVDAEHLTARLPTDLTVGSYALRVTDPRLGSNQLDDAFRVVSPQNGSDSMIDGSGETTSEEAPTDLATDSVTDTIESTPSDTAPLDGTADDTEPSTGGDTGLSSDTDSRAPGPTDTSGDAGDTETSDPSTDSEAPGDTSSLTDTASQSDTGIDPNDECDTLYDDSLLCTGFEEGIGFPVWYNGGGSASLSESVYHSGAASLHAHTTEEGEYASVFTEFSAVSSGQLYYRAYFYIPQGTLEGNIKLVGLYGGEDQLLLDINVMADGAVRLFHHEEGPLAVSAAGDVPEGVWFCLSGEVTVDDVDGGMTVRVDDTDVLTVVGTYTLPPNGLAGAEFGIGWTEEGQGEADVYVDDIVIDDDPVSCH